MWSRPNSVITFGQLILSKGSSHLDVSTGIWTAGTTGHQILGFVLNAFCLRSMKDRHQNPWFCFDRFLFKEIIWSWCQPCRQSMFKLLFFFTSKGRRSFVSQHYVNAYPLIVHKTLQGWSAHCKDEFWTRTVFSEIHTTCANPQPGIRVSLLIFHIYFCFTRWLHWEMETLCLWRQKEKKNCVAFISP